MHASTPPPSTAHDTAPSLSAHAVPELTERELARFPDLGVFANYAISSDAQTDLFFVALRRGERLVAVAPVTRIRSRRLTDLARSPLLRGLGRCIGPLARRTVLLLDTAFRAYDHAPPVLCTDEVDEAVAYEAVLAFLKAEGGAQEIWLAEPEGGARYARFPDLQTFRILPMVQVRTGGALTFDAYLRGLSKKRRRNALKEREAFARAGAEITEHETPLAPDLLSKVLRCLEASASRSALHVPYAALLNDPEAFARQSQTILVARIGTDVIGFFSLVQQGATLLQTHGGLDYARSLGARAYHNLTYAAIDLAIRRGLDRLGLGPLNNETKRRLGTSQAPVVVSLWCRSGLDRLVMRHFFIRRLQTYAGEFDG